MSQIEGKNPSQKEINEREWSDPHNWHYSFYFSRKDSRTFVPRRGQGITVNFASWGVHWFLLALMVPPIVIISTVVLSSGN